jgi:hypothetical protein
MIDINNDQFIRGNCNNGHILQRYTYQILVGNTGINFLYLIYCPICQVYYIGHRYFTKTAIEYKLKNTYYYTYTEMVEAIDDLIKINRGNN